MTRDSLRSADPMLAEALDRLPAPPPLGAGFTDRVLGEARRRSPATARRAGRRRWTNGRGIVIGAAALALTSAAAAGIGAFEPIGVRVPAIERIVEKVTGVPPVRVREQAPRKAAEAKAAAPATEAEVRPQAATPLPPREERLAQAIANRIDRRIARRERLGLPVPDAARDTDLRPSPEQAERNPRRAALADRVQEIRASRASARAAGASVDSAAPSVGTARFSVDRLAAEWPSLGWRDRLGAMRSLGPAERQAVFERLSPRHRQELLRLRAARALGIGLSRAAERRLYRRAREGFGRDPR